MDAGMWLVFAFFKREYWNFQDKLLLWFHEASQNLSLFRQLFFHGFQWGTKGKMLKKKQCIVLAIFHHFSFGPPLKVSIFYLEKWGIESHSGIHIWESCSPFYGKFVIIYQRRIPPKKFWILKIFGLRQNLTRQLQAQIKKGCSKFWICHTFKNFLNCGDNSTFKKRWADNVLKKISFHTRPIFDVKILEFWKKNFVKIFIDS